ncbi:hypothetical protein NCLIV_019080 [Neospora caninum Liverpool]|uniref:Uncharacterized protein n=1 Tax=Neospora caninum (strain Liverpool) TaxID=572307 RepID=F0VEH5_NEOCL|nr:hypothetical protein NCLIV_019080 [Neospora caninum Liverpool]CBZ52119.1 hypothetical protein NCLIV_019080 [Neospora caninum Liverpool]|eukprot:XP_003882151.1 hypothetical protein NCLIV_019080 [Neospora caninum Liverpool]
MAAPRHRPTDDFDPSTFSASFARKKASLASSAKKCLASSLVFLLASFLLAWRVPVLASTAAPAVDGLEGKETAGVLNDGEHAGSAEEKLVGAAVANSRAESAALSGDLDDGHDAASSGSAQGEAEEGEFAAVDGPSDVGMDDFSSLPPFFADKEHAAFADLVSSTDNSDVSGLINSLLSVMMENAEEVGIKDETSQPEDEGIRETETLVRGETGESGKVFAAVEEAEHEEGMLQKAVELERLGDHTGSRGAALRGGRNLSEDSPSEVNAPLPAEGVEMNHDLEGSTHPAGAALAEALAVGSVLEGFPDSTALLGDPTQADLKDEASNAVALDAQAVQDASSVSASTEAEGLRADSVSGNAETAHSGAENGPWESDGAAGNREAEAADESGAAAGDVPTASAVGVEEEPTAAAQSHRSRGSARQPSRRSRASRVGAAQRESKRKTAAKTLASVVAALAVLGGGVAAYGHVRSKQRESTITESPGASPGASTTGVPTAAV